jgi:hypothetical protein
MGLELKQMDLNFPMFYQNQTIRSKKAIRIMDKLASSKLRSFRIKKSVNS